MPVARSTTVVLTLFFLSQTFSFASTMLPTLLTDSGSVSAVQAGLILAGSSLLAGLWQPAVGRQLDRGRIGAIFAVVGVAYTIGIAAFFRQGLSLRVLTLGSFALFVSMTTLRTLVSTAVVARLPSEQRASMAGLRYLISNAAIGISALVAFAWLTTNRQPLLLVDLATTWGLAAGAAWFLRRERKLLAPPAVDTRAGGFDALSNAMRRYGWQISGLSLICIGFLAHICYLPLMYAKLGLPATPLNSLMLATNTACVVLAMRLTTYFGRKLGDLKISVGSTLLIGGGLAAAPWFTSYTGVVLTPLIWTLGEMIFVPWQQAKLYDYLPQNEPGVAAGALNLLMAVCQVFGPLVGTALLLVPLPCASVILLAVPLTGLAVFFIGQARLGRPVLAATGPCVAA